MTATMMTIGDAPILTAFLEAGGNSRCRGSGLEATLDCGGCRLKTFWYHGPEGVTLHRVELHNRGARLSRLARVVWGHFRVLAEWTSWFGFLLVGVVVVAHVHPGAVAGLAKALTVLLIAGAVLAVVTWLLSMTHRPLAAEVGTHPNWDEIRAVVHACAAVDGPAALVALGPAMQKRTGEPPYQFSALGGVA